MMDISPTTTSVPAGRKVVGIRWMFKIEADSTYKGRLVVQGVLKIPGVDCGGPFAPLCRLQSIRLMLAIVAKLDQGVHMLDAQTEFLNVNVKVDVFVKMAPGYETNDKAGVPLVMKLKKSLYDLQQSPKDWLGTMDVELAVSAHSHVGSVRIYLRGQDWIRHPDALRGRHYVPWRSRTLLNSSRRR